MELDKALDVARRAVEAAAAAALPHWERGVAVETKADRSPVTVADREAEDRILEVLSEAFPEHAILGEETGAHAGHDSPYRWTVDPIDGTRGFTRGGKFWGPLVALEKGGDVLVGAMAMPALGDVYWAARGLGCFKNGQRLKVSEVGDWADATVSLGEMAALFSDEHGPAVIDLVRTAASARGYGDLMGCAMVLEGLADCWLEAGVQPWDLGPTPVLIEEAGGRFSTFRGDQGIFGGTAIGSNGRVHDHALSALKG